MKLKDIFWPWGSVKRVAYAEALAQRCLEQSNKFLDDKIDALDALRRERAISDNLRGQCLCLHAEVDAIETAQTILEKLR